MRPWGTRDEYSQAQMSVASRGGVGTGDESWMRDRVLGLVASHPLRNERSDRRFTQSSGGRTRRKPAADNEVRDWDSIEGRERASGR